MCGKWALAHKGNRVKKVVLVFYCCVMNDHKASSLKQHRLAHSSEGQKSHTRWLHSLLGGSQVNRKSRHQPGWVLIWEQGEFCLQAQSCWRTQYLVIVVPVSLVALQASNSASNPSHSETLTLSFSLLSDPNLKGSLIRLDAPYYLCLSKSTVTYPIT